MKNWIAILLIISTVLACWSFSLFVRLISEYIARKRKLLRSEHRRGEIVRALLAMIMLIGGAAVAAWFAADLTRSMTDFQLDDAAVVLAIAIGLAVFSAMLLIWAIIGDRSRGRLRCPRCWYDMEGAWALQCPECGKTIKSERHLRSAKRSRWPFALAGVCIMLSVYGLDRHKRIEDTSVLALVPTRVLMVGWSILPDTWISRSNGKAHSGCLEDRLRESWVTVSAKDRFGRSLIHSMPRSKASRWDGHRTTLLATIYNNNATWLKYDDPEHPHPPSDISYGPILQLLALDALNAMTTKSPDMIDSQIIAEFSDHKMNAYNLIWTWMVFTSDHYAENDRFPGRLFNIDYQRSPITHALVFNELRDVLPSFQGQPFLDCIHHQREDIREAAFRLAIDTGLIDSDPCVFFEAQDQLGLRRSRIQQHLGRVLHLMSPQAQESAFAQLSDWIGSENARKRMYAISSIMYLQNNMGYDRDTEVPAYQKTVQQIIESSMMDDRTPYTDSPKVRISDQAMKVIARYDLYGDLFFPLQRMQILRGRTPTLKLYWFTNDPDRYQRSVLLWQKHFGDLFNSPSPKVRLWLVKRMPRERGTSIDEELNTLVAEMLYDADPEVQKEAYSVLVDRGATEHIPEGYAPMNDTGSL